MHPAVAVALKAARRPLPQVPQHVRQACSVGTVGANKTSTLFKAPIATTDAGGRPGHRTLPLRLARQPIRRTRRPAQPRHVLLRVLPADTGHRMTVCVRKPGVSPGIAVTKRYTSAARTRTRRRYERPIPGCLREGARSYVKVAPPGRGPLRDAGFDQRVGAEPLDRRRGGQDGSRATRRTSTNLLTRSLVATAPPLRSFAEPSSRAAPPEKDRNPVQTVAARWTCSATPCGRPASTDGDQHPVAVGRVGDLSDPAEGAHLAAPHPGHKGRRCGLLPGPARRRTEPGRGTHRPGSRRLPSDRRRPRPRPVPSGPQASPPSSPPAIRGTAQQRVTRRSTPGGHGRLDSSRRRGGSDRGQPGRTPSLGRGLAGAGDDRAHLNVGFRPLPQTTRTCRHCRAAVTRVR